MMFLISQMWPCLLLAALVGSILGWLLRKCKHRERISPASLSERSVETATLKEEQSSDNSTLSLASSTASVAGATYVANKMSDKPKIDPLDDEIIQLRYKLSAAELEAKTAKMKAETLQEQYERKLKDASDSFYNRDGYIQELQAKLDKSNKELASLKENLEKEKASKHHNDAEIARLKDEIEKYKKIEEEKIALEREYQKEKDNFNTKFSALSTSSQDYEESVKRLKSELDALRTEKENLETKYKSSHENAQNIENELASLKENLEKEKASKHHNDAEIARLKDEIEKYKKIEEEKIALEREYQKEKDNFNTKFSALSTSSQDYERHIKELESEIVDLKSKLSDNEHLKSRTISVKPEFLTAPKMGKADDLTLINGIGDKLNKKLNKLGVYHFWQIASWGEQEVAWVNEHLAFSGRIEREEWIAQAQTLSGEIKEIETKKPNFLKKPQGKEDNLELIKGIGTKLHKVLNDLGVYHFWQIASWNENEVAWVNEHLAFSGRIEREEWIEQAKILMKGHDTEFSKRVKNGEVETSQHNEPIKRHKHTKRLRKK